MAAVLAFAGSNSSTSINFKLVSYTASLVQEHKIQLLNMTHYPFPMYSADHERERGFSNSLSELRDEIEQADGLIISVNENNRNPSAYFKNLIDWLSRLDRKFLMNNKILLMSTSPGAGGGASSLSVINDLIPRFGGTVVATFSLPSFKENFDPDKGILNESLAAEHRAALDKFLSEIA